jgi:cytochrome d ubiquinol oxidase subunit I
MFSMAMWMAVVVAPIQIIAGDLHGLNTLEYQPAKIAALEGNFETRAGMPLILFGIPNASEERVDYAVSIPKLGSLILTHDPNGIVRGLKEWPKDKRPPVGIVFWSFRIMLVMGFAMLAIGAWSLFLRYKGRLYDSAWMHRAAILMGPSGFSALLAGWFTTEIGRQPYTVYGLLTTAASVSAIDAAAVGASLLTFIIVYFLVFGTGTFYVFRLMSKPPADAAPDLPSDEPIRAAGIMPGPAPT